MGYGSMPYVMMALKKNVGHIQSTQHDTPEMRALVNNHKSYQELP